jgi:hypothetical protein
LGAQLRQIGRYVEVNEIEWMPPNYVCAAGALAMREADGREGMTAGLPCAWLDALPTSLAKIA